MSFSECVGWKILYEANGYPSVASFYSTQTCGDRLVGLVVLTILAGVITFYLGRKLVVRRAEKKGEKE